MFKHSGKKIKAFAIVLTILGFVLAAACAAAVLLTKISFGVEMNSVTRIIAAIAILILGALGSYVCGLILYSWGEMVERSKESHYILTRIASHSKESAAYLSRERMDK